MTLFWLQIVDRQGAVVRLPGGPLERDLIQCCTKAIVAKGVGFLKSEAQVRAAIESGITETLTELIRHTKYVAQ